jgi:predicted AAA+ superfamily ATPase
MLPAGGSGKTTMAQLLYSRLEQQFLHKAFLQLNTDSPDAQTGQLMDLLQQLGLNPSKVAGGDKKLLEQLEEFVKHKPVLLVLDNVSSAEQLDGLLPTQWGSGSQLIITSRSPGFHSSRVWQVRRTLMQLAASR